MLKLKNVSSFHVTQQRAAWLQIYKETNFPKKYTLIEQNQKIYNIYIHISHLQVLPELCQNHTDSKLLSIWFHLSSLIREILKAQDFNFFNLKDQSTLQFTYSTFVFPFRLLIFHSHFHDIQMAPASANVVKLKQMKSLKSQSKLSLTIEPKYLVSPKRFHQRIYLIIKKEKKKFSFHGQENRMLNDKQRFEHKKALQKKSFNSVKKNYIRRNQIFLYYLEKTIKQQKHFAHFSNSLL